MSNISKAAKERKSLQQQYFDFLTSLEAKNNKLLKSESDRKRNRKPTNRWQPKSQKDSADEEPEQKKKRTKLRAGANMVQVKNEPNEKITLVSRYDVFA